MFFSVTFWSYLLLILHFIVPTFSNQKATYYSMIEVLWILIVTFGFYNYELFFKEMVFELCNPKDTHKLHNLIIFIKK